MLGRVWDCERVARNQEKNILTVLRDVTARLQLVPDKCHGYGR